MATEVFLKKCGFCDGRGVTGPEADTHTCTRCNGTGTETLASAELTSVNAKLDAIQATVNGNQESMKLAMEYLEKILANMK